MPIEPKQVEDELAFKLVFELLPDPKDFYLAMKRSTT
jgi:hypothetical protein